MPELHDIWVLANTSKTCYILTPVLLHWDIILAAIGFDHLPGNPSFILLCFTPTKFALLAFSHFEFERRKTRHCLFD